MARMRVLVVEDDPELRGLLREILADEGHDVWAVAHGVAGLAALEGGWSPDVILVNLRMPVMDGWAFLRERRRQRLCPGARVVVSTAWTDVPEVKELGAEAVVPKPFDIDDLVRAVSASEAPLRLARPA